MLIYAFDEVVCRNIITFVKLTKIDQFKKATLFKSKNKNIFNIFLNKFQRFNNCLFFRLVNIHFRLILSHAQETFIQTPQWSHC